MDDDLICSDLCEENGYLRQAQLLRATARGGLTAYVVMERGAEFRDGRMFFEDGVPDMSVHLDRDEAERVAAERNLGWFRRNNVFGCVRHFGDITDLSAEELARRIGEILGRPFELPNGGRPLARFSRHALIDESATDEQFARIFELFRYRYYFVVETQFAGQAPEETPA